MLRPGRPLEFVHPIVRAAVRDDLPVSQRIAMHQRAAEILLADGAAPERVGVHLLGTDPGGLAWVVTALRDAAEAARSRGAPDAAAEFLRRALAEPPPREARADLLTVGRLHPATLAATRIRAEEIDPDGPGRGGGAASRRGGVDHRRHDDEHALGLRVRAVGGR